ncbi:MAG: phosphoribosylformylglycinamidine synthase, partial [Gammaproteobacteria bacterium]
QLSGVEVDVVLKAAASSHQFPLYDRMTEQLVGADYPPSSVFEHAEPVPFERIAISSDGRSALEQANQQLGLALSGDEIDYLIDFYQSSGRDPSDAELMMFAQINSEHCRHKIFNASWDLDGVPQPETLFGMIRNTHHLHPQGTLVAYSDNSSVIEGTDGSGFEPVADSHYTYTAQPVLSHILMKVETHNHPTAIAPLPGAATGSGGEIRDEGATGRGSRPKAGLAGFSVSNLEIPGAVQPWESEYGRPDRIASALEIMIAGPIGAAAFNNEFGRPNITGYFRSYEQRHQGDVRGYHKPIMVAGGLGSIREGQTEKLSADAGALVIQLGGPSMPIGVGGGAASSMATGSNVAELDFNSVQRHNPEMQRRCQEVIDACWRQGSDNPIRSIHDVGAGGLSNAVPELVDDAGMGGRLQLRNIHSADSGMSPLQLWSNESQERYVMLVDVDRLQEFSDLCARERCPFAVLGEVTDDLQLLVEDSQFDNAVIDMPMPVLLGKPPRLHRTGISAAQVNPAIDLAAITVDEAVDRVLALPTVADKSFLITIGDRSVGGLVARDQMVGPWQTPVADVAVTHTDFEHFHGEAMAMGERSPVALIDSTAAARLAVTEAVCNLLAADIAELSDIKLSANWMAACGDELEDGRLFEAVRTVGMEFCPALGLSIPVGKDSLSMRTGWQDEEQPKSVTSPVSLVISAFAPVVDVRRTLTPMLDTEQAATLLLIDLSAGRNRLGGSALAQVFNQVGDQPADCDDPELLKQFAGFIIQARREGLLLAYHDRSDGGLLVTLAEMAFAARTGLDIDMKSLTRDGAEETLLAQLFCEEPGAVIQVAAVNLERINELAQTWEIQTLLTSLGGVTDDGVFTIRRGPVPVVERPLIELLQRWSSTSYQIRKLRDNPESAEAEFRRLKDKYDPGLTPELTFGLESHTSRDTAGPRVAIVREQGVNGHREMAAAFHAAGFTAVDVHMSDIIAGRVDLQSFRGLVACGGFSFGDVLGAGRGWANTILHNQQARAAFEQFFSRPDTFALGVCNGCQMMAQLRELIPGAESWPAFQRNQSEQFEARLSLVRVEESPSIFLTGMAGSHLPVVVSHGEGQVAISADQAEQLTDQQQVALRYVDNYGKVTERYPANPNGSTGGITSLTTEDGRFTIMMPHPERVFRGSQLSWSPSAWGDASPWMTMFNNAYRWSVA